MYLTESALQSALKQEFELSRNQWQAATDNKLAELEFQEDIEGEQQWLEMLAYQHDRYLYADRI